MHGLLYSLLDVCSKVFTVVLCFLIDRYVSGGGPAEAEKARILLKLMQFIGAVSGGKTVTQVALNYLMCKGTICVAHAATALLIAVEGRRSYHETIHSSSRHSYHLSYSYTQVARGIAYYHCCIIGFVEFRQDMPSGRCGKISHV